MNGFVVSASSAIAFLRSGTMQCCLIWPDERDLITKRCVMVKELTQAMMAAPESSVLRPVSSEGFLKAQHLKHYFCDLCR